MPSLATVRASNAKIASTLPPDLVAVYVGSTSGIGEHSMLRFAKHVPQPRIYFVGRSQEAADRLIAEMKGINPKGSYTFLQKDTSLLKNVDAVCKDIKSREKHINVLHLSTGSLNFDKQTDEGLGFAVALTTYSRARFVVNLLPLLQAAPGLRRVVSVFAGTKEGQMDVDNFQKPKLPVYKYRGHATTLVTFSLETLAQKAPDVSFVHDYPGHVRGNLIRGDEGAIFQVLKVIGKVVGNLYSYIPDEECGERHVYLATSARFEPAAADEKTAGVPTGPGVSVATGSDGEQGSGMYVVDQDCESGNAKVMQVLGEQRRAGVRAKVGEKIEQQFLRITGTLSI